MGRVDGELYSPLVSYLIVGSGVLIRVYACERAVGNFYCDPPIQHFPPTCINTYTTIYATQPMIDKPLDQLRYKKPIEDSLIIHGKDCEIAL